MWANKDSLKLYKSFLKERESVRKKREAGAKPPWTKDEVLQQYKFTNVFRTDDRVTQHYMRFISPIDEDQVRQVLFNTVMYRIINWPYTMNCLGRLDYSRMSAKKAHFAKVFTLRKEAGLKLYTGAYMITASPEEGVDKHHATWESLTTLAGWLKAGNLERLIYPPNAPGYFELLTNTLSSLVPRVGKFIAYEVVTDLSYTWLKRNHDVYEWANAGPGAVRGLNRLMGRDVKQRIPESHSLQYMQDLLWELRRNLSSLVAHRPSGWTIRDVEHSLCEFDKYCRVRNGEGRPRSMYPGGSFGAWKLSREEEAKLHMKEKEFINKNFPSLSDCVPSSTEDY